MPKQKKFTRTAPTVGELASRGPAGVFLILELSSGKMAKSHPLSWGQRWRLYRFTRSSVRRTTAAYLLEEFDLEPVTSLPHRLRRLSKAARTIEELVAWAKSVERELDRKMVMIFKRAESETIGTMFIMRLAPSQ